MTTQPPIVGGGRCQPGRRDVIHSAQSLYAWACFLRPSKANGTYDV